MSKVRYFIKESQVLLLIFLFSITFNFFISAQKGYEAILQYKTGQDTSLWINSVLPDREGGFYIKGKLGLADTQSYTFYARLDCQGNPLWTRVDTVKKYGNILYSLGNPLSTEEITRSNMLLTNNFRLLDDSGRLIANKSIKNTTTGQDLIFIRMKKNIDGGWIIFVRGNYDNDRGPEKMSSIIRTDRDFNILWSKSFLVSRKSVRSHTSRYDISIDSSGIYLVGSTFYKWFYIIALDQDGNLKYYNTYVNKITAQDSYHDRFVILHNTGSLFIIRGYNWRANVGSFFNIGIHKISKEDGAVEKVAIIYDQSNIEPPNTLEYDAFIGQTFNCELSARQKILISCRNINYISDTSPPTPLYWKGEVGAATRIELDTALQLIQAERLDLEKDSSIVTIKQQGAHGIIYISDSTAFFPYENYDRIGPIFNSASVFISHRTPQRTQCLNYFDMTPYIQSKILPKDSLVKERFRFYRMGPGVTFIDESLSVFKSFTLKKASTLCFTPPSLKAEISSVHDTYCLGDTISFNATSRYDYLYEWYIDQRFIGDGEKDFFLPSKPGEYLLSLIISDGCFADTVSKPISVVGADTTILDPVLLCQNDTLIIQDSSIHIPGTYYFNYQNHTGCDSIAVLSVYIYNPPHISIDTALCQGESFRYEDFLTQKDTLIEFTLQNEFGCDSFILYNIHFDLNCDKCRLRLPIAFSPNGDQVNDFLMLLNPCHQIINDFEFHIFNRWGTLVYQSSDPDGVWDGTFKGKPMPSAVYLVQIRGTLNNKPFTIRQDITLIR